MQWFMRQKLAAVTNNRSLWHAHLNPASRSRSQNISRYESLSICSIDSSLVSCPCRISNAFFGLWFIVRVTLDRRLCWNRQTCPPALENRRGTHHWNFWTRNVFCLHGRYYLRYLHYFRMHSNGQSGCRIIIICAWDFYGVLTKIMSTIYIESTRGWYYGYFQLRIISEFQNVEKQNFLDKIIFRNFQESKARWVMAARFHLKISKFRFFNIKNIMM